MTEEQQLAALEEAILARARSLADEIGAKAARQRDELLRTANERINLMEQREILAAKANAERLFRRQVQASELQLQQRLEELRWHLVLEQEQQLGVRFRQFCNERDAYLAWLKQLLIQGLEHLPGAGVVVEVNEEDLHWLQPLWHDLQSALKDGERLQLATRPCRGSGGLLLTDAEGRTRLDNRFEGLLARQRETIVRTLQQHLFLNLP